MSTRRRVPPRSSRPRTSPYACGDEVRRARPRRLRRRAARRARRAHAARSRAHAAPGARSPRTAEVGRAEVIPPGLPPGSDVGNLAILGYDPAEYHTGRAPIEAAAMGVDLAPDEVAYRCNLVTVGATARRPMVDFAAGHLTSEQSHPIVAALDAALGNGRDGVRFHPGVEYRHLCVVPRDLGDAECVPPHDLTGRPIVLPTGPAAAKLIALMDASKPVVAAAAAEVGSVATQIWLWGQGTRPQLPDVRGALRRHRSAVVGGRPRARARRAHRHRGASTSPARPPASTTTTSRSATPRSRRSPTATSSSCTSRPPTKPGTRARSTRRSRRSSAGTPTSSGRSSTRLGDEPYRILLLPDHATPCAARTHTSDPVPYLLFDDRRAPAPAASTPSAASPGCTPVARPRPDGAPARADPPRGGLPSAVGRAVQCRRRRSILRPTLVADPGFR